MEPFRHNLTPPELKKFLKIVSPKTEHLLIRFCWKITLPCPKCNALALCRAGALSFYASNPDKVTHEITACLKCDYSNISMLRTIESL